MTLQGQRITVTPNEVDFLVAGYSEKTFLHPVDLSEQEMFKALIARQNNCRNSAETNIYP